MFKWLFGRKRKKQAAQPRRNPGPKKRRSVKPVSPELAKAAQEWEKLGDQNMWMLVVFTRGKSHVAEVVRINGAIIEKGKLGIETEVLRIGNDASTGPYVNPTRYLQIDPAKIIWREIVKPVSADKFAKYERRLAKRRR